MSNTRIDSLMGLALNWAVAFALGRTFEFIEFCDFWGIQDPEDSVAYDVLPEYVQSWGAGGALQDLENIGVKPHFDPQSGQACFLATAWNEHGTIGTNNMLGATKLEAIARCFVAKRLGVAEIKLPQGLLETV